jgi:hypothetical protein
MMIKTKIALAVLMTTLAVAPASASKHHKDTKPAAASTTRAQ